jgi:hypothetical protein
LGTFAYLTRIASFGCAAALLACSTGESRLEDDGDDDAGSKHEAGRGDAGNERDSSTGNERDSSTGNDAGDGDGSANDAGPDQDSGIPSDGGCVACFPDPDKDGYAVEGAVSAPVCGMGCASGFTSRVPSGAQRDCNGTDALIHPGAPERCNGVNDNCDAVVDEGAAATCALANATAQCTSGQCRVQTCSSGYGDCSTTAAGCEQALNVTAHCGACRRTCPALSACAGAVGSARCQCARATFEMPSTNGTFGCMGSGPLSVGRGAVCAIRSTGAVSCWGGTAPAATARFKQIGVGQGFAVGGACGVTAAGTIQCWLLQDPVAAPPPAPPSGSSYLTATRGNALCGIDSAGRATCAGGVPEDHPSASRTYRQIAVGFGHMCALAEDGSVTCSGWGTSTQADCGDFNAFECGQAAPIPGPFVQIALGMVHSCGLRPTGTVSCWGAGRAALNSTPFELRQGVAPAVAFRYISASAHRTCGIRALDNGLECWGEPYEMVTPGGEYDVVSAGDDFACALAKTGNIRCWGALTGLDGTTIPSSITGPFPLIPPG